MSTFLDNIFFSHTEQSIAANMYWEPPTNAPILDYFCYMAMATHYTLSQMASYIPGCHEHGFPHDTSDNSVLSADTTYTHYPITNKCDSKTEVNILHDRNQLVRAQSRSCHLPIPGGIFLRLQKVCSPTSASQHGMVFVKHLDWFVCNT